MFHSHLFGSVATVFTQYTRCAVQQVVRLGIKGIVTNIWSTYCAVDRATLSVN